MKKKLICIGVLLLGLFCACTGKKTTEKPIMTPTPSPKVTATPVPTNTPMPAFQLTEEQLAEQKVEEYLAELPTMDWTELDCYIDEEMSRRCSNLLNYGELTYDKAGNIYFTNANDNLAGAISGSYTTGIFVSDYNGENMRQLCEDGGSWMQIEGSWLYYRSREGGIARVHIETGEREQIYGEECGQFFTDGERMIINSPKGIVITDMEGNFEESLLDGIDTEKVSVSHFVPVNGFWLSNAYLGLKIDKNGSLYKKGYLIVYDGETAKLLNQKGTEPLLAGNYLSVQDPKSYLRHIWNLKTGEEFTLDVPSTGQMVVSDGKNLYCRRLTYKDVRIYCWDGAELEELIRLEDASAVDFMYLTPKALYYVLQRNVNGKFVYCMMYYDLESGETGQVY